MIENAEVKLKAKQNAELKARGVKQLRHAARNFWYLKHQGEHPQDGDFTFDVDGPLLRVADFLEYGTAYKNRAARMLRELATAIEGAKS